MRQGSRPAPARERARRPPEGATLKPKQADAVAALIAGRCDNRDLWRPALGKRDRVAPRLQRALGNEREVVEEEARARAHADGAFDLEVEGLAGVRCDVQRRQRKL